jgi:hypothetical protein
MDKCKECGGTGVIEKNEKAFECVCAFIRRMALSMPGYIRRAEIRREHLSQNALKGVKKHLLIISSWQDMKAVIKAAMIANPSTFIKITSDREIRDVYVGSKSKAARGDEDGAIYNSLEDLMDPPNLMIVRLNELSYKNKAAPGALEEAVSYRVDRDKPTWLFSDMDKPFMTGSHAYSDSVADVIKSSFPITRIPRILPNVSLLEDDQLIPQHYEQPEVPVRLAEPTTIEPEPADAAETTEGVPKKTTSRRSPAPDESESPKVSVKSKIRPSPDDDADVGYGLSRFGSGLSDSKSKFKGNRRS